MCEYDSLHMYSNELHTFTTTVNISNHVPWKYKINLTHVDSVNLFFKRNLSQEM